MPPIFNFLPLLVWMLAFYALNQRRGENVVPPSNPGAVFFVWLLGIVIFLAVGIWISARS